MYKILTYIYIRCRLCLLERANTIKSFLWVKAIVKEAKRKLVNAKIILSIATFLLINLPLNTSYSDSDIAALGNLKGIYVNLKINDKVPQGIPKQRIDKKRLLKYIEKELINTIGKERGIRLFKAIDPHLNVEVIIEGQELHAADGPKKYKYYVTVKASLERNASEWHLEHTELWTENTKIINMWEKNVREAIVRLDKAKKAKAPSGINQKTYRTNEINYATSKLALAKKMLASSIKTYTIGSAAELGFKIIASRLRVDYKVANKLKKEYEKKEKETEELLSQLEAKEETNSTQPDEQYIEYESRYRLNILYEIGNTIRLHNPSDTSVALYKDESFSNITILFSNGIKASIMDYKVLPDKPVVYKIKILLKDGSEYIGWVPESVISK